MKKVSLMMSLALLTGAIGVFLVGCSKDDDPTPLTLVSLTAGGKDLNGASSAEDVDRTADIVAEFSTALDEATVNAANITLTNTIDNSVVAITITTAGAVVTINPNDDLREGANYSLAISAGLKSAEGSTLSAAATRTFSVAGILVPDGQVAYWNFNDGNATDQQGSYDASAEIAMTYVAGRSTDAGMAAKFDGDASIIEIPNGDVLLTSTDFTISFWMKTESDGHVNETGNPTGHFVLGLGAFYGIQYEVYGGYDGAKFAVRYASTDDTGAPTTVAEDMWFPSNATDASTGGWQGWDFAKSVTPEDMAALYLKDVWTQVVLTYNGTEKTGTLYYDGEKMKSFDFDLWPAGDTKTRVTGTTYSGVAPEVVNELAFGFIQSRAGTLWDAEPWGGYDIPTSQHFKGQLDDIRIFHSALTSSQVSTLYNSEKP